MVWLVRGGGAEGLGGFLVKYVSEYAIELVSFL